MASPKKSIVVKNFILVLFSLAAIQLSAQNDWLGNVYFDDEVTRIFFLSNGQMVLLMDDESLVLPEAQGNAMKKLELTQENYGGMTVSLIEMGDSNLVFTQVPACDVIFSICYVFDKDWELLDAIILDWYPLLAAVYRLQDGTFFLFSYQGKAQRYAADLVTLLGEKDLAGSEIVSLLLPGDTLVFYQAGQLVKMTPDFEEVKSVGIGPVEALKLASDGGILAFGPDGITKFDSDLNLFGSQGFASAKFRDAAVSDAEFAVLTDPPSVIRFDNALATIGGFDPVLAQGTKFNTLAYRADSLLLAGRKRWGTPDFGNRSGFVQRFSLDGQTSPATGDVALMQVQHTGSVHTEGGFTVDQIGYWQATFTALQFTVHNQLPDTLKSLVLNTRLPEVFSPLWCPEEREFSFPVSGLQVPPGATAAIVLDTFRVLLTGSEVEDFFPCFWLSFPNGEWDVNPENDVVCLSLPLATGQPGQPEALSIFPNPVAEELSVVLPDLPAGPGRFLLTDALGRNVKQWTVQAGQQNQRLSLDALPAGVYVLLLQHEGRVVGRGRVFIR